MLYSLYSVFILLVVAVTIYGAVIPENVAHDRFKRFEEEHELVEGDIMVRKRHVLKSPQGEYIEKRKASSWARQWPDGIVPYEFSYGWSQEEKDHAYQAIADYHKHTCIKFYERQNHHKRYLHFGNGQGCYSTIGQQWNEGEQLVSLPGLCRHPSTITHELGHALGLYHEQSRSDRDSFVHIISSNVNPSMLSNFDKEETNNYGIPYDYHSIMHYGKTSFSYNGEMTIYTIDQNYQDVIGRAQSLSFFDVAMITDMYNCSDHCDKKECPDGGFLNHNCECLCWGDPIRLCEDKPTPAPPTVTTTTISPVIKKCVHFAENIQGRIDNRFDENFHSWEDCEHFCRYSRPGCTHWVWHDEYTGMYKYRCSTMTGFSNTVPQPGITWGSLTCEDEVISPDDCMVSGQNLQGRKNSRIWDGIGSWQAFQQKCKAVNGCKAWVWHDKSMGYYYKRCVTMTGYSNTAINAGVLHGTLPC